MVWEIVAKSRTLLHRIASVKSSYFPWQFLSASAKLRKAIIKFVISVRLSVRMEQLCSHWTDFYEIMYLNILRKSVNELSNITKILLKSDKNKYFTWQPMYIFYYISFCSFFLMRNVLYSFVDEINTHILFHCFTAHFNSLNFTHQLMHFYT